MQNINLCFSVRVFDLCAIKKCVHQVNTVRVECQVQHRAQKWQYKKSAANNNNNDGINSKNHDLNNKISAECN